MAVVPTRNVPLERLQPPTNEAMLGADGAMTQAWRQHFQRVSDQTRSLSDALHTGTTTNDDAVAGFVGEYITASFAATGLTNATPADLGSISLTAGDWDVRGWVSFVSASNSLRVVQGWVNTVAVTASLAAGITLPAGGMGTGTALWAGPVRFSLAATTSVLLGVQATFSTPPASAGGFIAARRAR